MSDTKRINDLPKLPARGRDAHKGDFGRVLIAGGSRGMIGAVALAANAALRGGAGLVTFAAPRTVQQVIASMCPCATSTPLYCDEAGNLTAQSVGQFLRSAQDKNVLAIGPGMGVGIIQQSIVQAALEQEKPLVLDADGLNNLAKINDWPTKRRCPLVLTPHCGEFARLTDLDVQNIRDNREGSAVEAVNRWTGDPGGDYKIVCVLKGAGTVVTDGQRVFVNDTGNPGMATGGSGDVLTGLLAAMIAQGLEPFEAACLAAGAHGLAGDIAADELGEVSLMASDLLDYLPQALRRLA